MVMVISIYVVRTQQVSCDIRSFRVSAKKMAAERFKQVTTSDVHQIINNAVPENTKKETKFYVKIFNG